MLSYLFIYLFIFWEDYSFLRTQDSYSISAHIKTNYRKINWSNTPRRLPYIAMLSHLQHSGQNSFCEVWPGCWRCHCTRKWSITMHGNKRLTGYCVWIKWNWNWAEHLWYSRHREIKVILYVTTVHQNLNLFPSFSRAMSSISEHTYSLLIFLQNVTL